MSPSVAWDIELESLLFRKLKSRVAPYLFESISYSLLSPGKRLRPQLCWEVGVLLRAPQGPLKLLSLAFECIHCSTLIHDDLPAMDNDDVRRGKPSNHRVFGEAVALLAGNALLCLGFDCVRDLLMELGPQKFEKIFDIFYRAAGPSGVISGQALEFSPRLNDSNDSIRAVRELHNLKTGVLIQASVMSACILARSPLTTEEEKCLEHFGKTFGECFQISDDLADDDPAKITWTHLPALIPPLVLRSEVQKRLSAQRASLLEIFGKKAQPLIALIEPLIGTVQPPPFLSTSATLFDEGQRSNF